LLKKIKNRTPSACGNSDRKPKGVILL
jgi:hypothetical protein